MTLKIHGRHVVEHMEKINRLKEMRMMHRHDYMEIARLMARLEQTKKEITNLENEIKNDNFVTPE